VTTESGGAAPARGKASLFDLRWILAVLFGIYGIVVTLMGLLANAKTISASGQDVNVNVNLWTGVPMIVLAALFAVWAMARPLVAPVAGAGDVSPEGSADGTAGRG
jgi:hypothetical protein